MPVRIYTTNAGTDLSDAESALLADLIARHGRAVLLAPTFAELDLCRHDAAEAGVSLGIDYKTPTSWLRSLWELLGDGRGFVDNLQRQMLFSDMVTRLDDADLQPLSRSQGTVRMLARMARDVLPGVAGTTAERCRGNNCQPEPKSDAEARVFELLRAYAGGLDRRDMVEPCEAADIMAGALADNLPACTRAVCVRGVTSFTHGLLELQIAPLAGTQIHGDVHARCFPSNSRVKRSLERDVADLGQLQVGVVVDGPVHVPGVREQQQPAAAHVLDTQRVACE